MNRRKLFQTTALGLSLWLLVAVRAADWPQWRGPNRDGVWNETGILESFPAGGLNISWRVPVGRGWSSPVVAQGRVYVTDVEVVRPAARERVLCFDEANGKLLWSHPYAVEYPDWALDPNAGGPGLHRSSGTASCLRWELWATSSVSTRQG
jgi:outer membrane protein assembly factor BamB